MKKILIILLTLLCFLPVNTLAKKDNKVKLYLFYSDTCPHCKAEINYLNSIKNKYKDVEFIFYNKDTETELLSNVRKKLNIDNSYTPLTVVGTYHIIGFSEDTKKEIKRALNEYLNVNSFCDITNTKDAKKCIDKNKDIDKNIKSDIRVVPFLGEVNVKTTSLALIAAVIGFVDGFNPCAMWVLIFIISLLIEMKDKKKMIVLGLTFILSSGLVYVFFMLSWLKLTNSLMSTWFRYIIAIVALVAGIINLRNYIKTRKSETGCTVTNKKERKKIVARVQKIIHENNFFIAIIGIILLAFSVNLIELACSAGLPTFFITILGMNDLNVMQYALYIFIYILFFLIDDIVIFLIATLTFKITAISNKYNKYSHLVGGIICLIIGILLAFFPSIIMFNM